MSLAEGIREVVADVGVQTADINTGAITAALLGGSAVTTAKLQGSAVTTAKLGNSAVTTAKLAIAAGKWITGTFGVAGTSTAFSLTMTGACTIIQAIVQLSAACSAGCVFNLENTADLAILDSRVASTAVTHAGPVHHSVISAEQVLVFSAAATLRCEFSEKPATASGTYYIQYIATP